jgi:hypothetical protein
LTLPDDVATVVVLVAVAVATVALLPGAMVLAADAGAATGPSSEPEPNDALAV